MHALLAQLRQDHVNYSRLLNLLEIQLISLQAGKAADFNQMRDIMKYMMNYPDALHHPFEELLFDLARRRDLPADAQRTLDRLESEHALLAELGARLEQWLGAAAGGNIVSKAALMEDAGRYLETMRGHVRCEEREVFPVLDSRLRESDWSEAEQALRDIPDPVFGPAIADEYQQLYNSVMESAHA